MKAFALLHELIRPDLLRLLGPARLPSAAALLRFSALAAVEDSSSGQPPIGFFFVPLRACPCSRISFHDFKHQAVDPVVKTRKPPEERRCDVVVDIAIVAVSKTTSQSSLAIP
jgi:hypothetical protein